MTFELPIDPSIIATAQQKGARVVNGHVVFYTKKRVREAEEKLRDALKRVRHGFFVPKPDAVLVSAIFHFPYPKGTPKKDSREYTIMTERPDSDNLLKGLIDSMSPKVAVVKGFKIITDMGWFHDDSQVMLGQVFKLRTPDTPKVIMSVNRIDHRNGIIEPIVREMFNPCSTLN